MPRISIPRVSEGAARLVRSAAELCKCAHVHKVFVPGVTALIRPEFRVPDTAFPSVTRRAMLGQPELSRAVNAVVRAMMHVPTHIQGYLDVHAPRPGVLGASPLDLPGEVVMVRPDCDVRQAAS